MGPKRGQDKTDGVPREGGETSLCKRLTTGSGPGIVGTTLSDAV